MLAQDTPPFFIVGAGRSGTTLLRLMLCGHPKLFIPPEAWFLGNVMWHLPSSGALSKEDLAECERLILSGDRWKDWQCSDERLREILRGCAGLDLASVIDRLFREVFDLPPGVRWGEKTPKHSYLVERIGAIFPESQFIHLIRDGRDVASSMLARGWFGANPRRVAEHWRSCVSGASKASAFGPRRYLEVRFESLVEHPEAGIRNICGFLGADFVPSMLAYQKQVGRFIPSGEGALHNKLNAKLSAGEVGKWIDSLSAWQEAVFWNVAWREMRSLYPSAKPRFASRLLSPSAGAYLRADRLKGLVASKLPRHKPWR